MIHQAFSRQIRLVAVVRWLSQVSLSNHSQAILIIFPVVVAFKRLAHLSLRIYSQAKAINVAPRNKKGPHLMTRTFWL